MFKAKIPSKYSIDFLLIPIKIILLSFSIYALDAVGNIFRRKDQIVSLTAKEYLFFTNFSLILTIACVVFGSFYSLHPKLKDVYTVQAIL